MNYLVTARPCNQWKRSREACAKSGYKYIMEFLHQIKFDRWLTFKIVLCDTYLRGDSCCCCLLL